MTSQWLWRAMSWTFAWEDQIRSRNQSSMHLQIPAFHQTVTDQKPMRNPRPRHHLDVSSERELTEEPRGKMPRRAETSESVVPFHSSEASSSELQQTSTAAASDNPTGERLYLSRTEEGPSGDHKMTMQRDRHGRWMPTKGARTMNIQKAREERRNFYVGRSQEHATFSIASAEASTLHGEFYLSRRNADDVSWKHLSAEGQTFFFFFESNRNRMAGSAQFQGGEM